MNKIVGTTEAAFLLDLPSINPKSIKQHLADRIVAHSGALISLQIKK